MPLQSRDDFIRFLDGFLSPAEEFREFGGGLPDVAGYAFQVAANVLHVRGNGRRLPGGLADIVHDGGQLARRPPHILQYTLNFPDPSMGLLQQRRKFPDRLGRALGGLLHPCRRAVGRLDGGLDLRVQFPVLENRPDRSLPFLEPGRNGLEVS